MSYDAGAYEAARETRAGVAAALAEAMRYVLDEKRAPVEHADRWRAHLAAYDAADAAINRALGLPEVKP